MFQVAINRLRGYGFSTAEEAVDAVFALGEQQAALEYATVIAHIPEAFKFLCNDFTLDMSRRKTLEKRAYSKNTLLDKFIKTRSGSMILSYSLWCRDDENPMETVFIQLTDMEKAQRWVETNKDAKEIGAVLEALGGGKSQFGNGIDMKVKKKRGGGFKTTAE